jgi:hypothetical protein
MRRMSHLEPTGVGQTLERSPGSYWMNMCAKGHFEYRSAKLLLPTTLYDFGQGKNDETICRLASAAPGRVSDCCADSIDDGQCSRSFAEQIRQKPQTNKSDDNLDTFALAPMAANKGLATSRRDRQRWAWYPSSVFGPA